MITGITQLLGVIGHPIAHSLSPVMHNAAIAELGVDFVYLPFAIPPQDLTTGVEGLEILGIQGFNVTIPHKQAIMPLLREISPVAQAIGAVNTVCRIDRIEQGKGQGWYGTNTDVDGFLAPLLPLQRNWNQETAVILGNGGTARAVVAGCAQLGCGVIQVVGRDSKKLQAFQQSWQATPMGLNPAVFSWEKLPELLPDATLVINTTPIGMHPQAEASPLQAEELSQIQPGTIAYDLIYTPRPTLFLQQMQAQGAIIFDGLEMLIQQGAAALQLWLQQPVPVAVMRQSLLDYLNRDNLNRY